MKRTKAKPAGPSVITDTYDTLPESTVQNGDLILRYLWYNGTDSVHNMRVVNTDDNYYW